MDDRWALADFENLLKASMGLNAASIGSSAIERAVQERLAACHLDDPHAYLGTRPRIRRPSCRS